MKSISNVSDFWKQLAACSPTHNEIPILQIDKSTVYFDSKEIWILTDYKKGYFKAKIQDIIFKKTQTNK